MKMMVNAGDRAAIQDYVNRISASLKGIDQSQKQVRRFFATARNTIQSSCAIWILSDIAM